MDWAALSLAVTQLPVRLGPREWGMVALSSIVIFTILGRRLAGDIRRWMGRVPPSES